jgi:hypothetical protein
MMTVGAMAVVVGVQMKIIQRPPDFYNPDLRLLLDNRTRGL